MASTNTAFKFPYKILIILMGVTIFIFWTSSKQKFDNNCKTYADPVRVKIHDTRFNLPAAYEPTFSSKISIIGLPEVEAPLPVKFYTKNKAKFSRGYCQKPNSSDVKVWGISLVVNELDISKKPPIKSYVGDESDTYGFSANYNPQIIPIYDHHSRYNYCEVFVANHFGIGEKKKFSENPLFYEFKTKEKSYYISNQVTLFGNPSVIACNKDKSCILMAPINNDAETEIGFTPNKIQPKDWPDFILKYQNFLKSLMPDNNGIKIFPNCGYLFDDAKRIEDSVNEGRVPN